MKIKDLCNEYSDIMQPDENFRNALENKLEGTISTNDKVSCVSEISTETVEYKKISLGFIVPLIAAISILCTLTFAASLFRNKSDDKNYFETTSTQEETSDSEYQAVSETDINNISVNHVPSDSISDIQTDISFEYYYESHSEFETEQTAEKSSAETTYTAFETKVSSETEFSTETTTPMLHYIENVSGSQNSKYSECIYFKFDTIHASAGEEVVMPMRISKAYSPYALLVMMNFNNDYISLKNIRAYDESGNQCMMVENFAINYFTVMLEYPFVSDLELEVTLYIDESAPSGSYEINYDIENGTGNGDEWNFININGILQIK